MKHILYIQSSILGEQSQTRALVQAAHVELAARHPQAQHTVRDLAAEPLPHLRGEHFATRPAETEAALAELKSADLVVIGAPMYNFSVPSTLKAWFDHVMRAGETFRYTEAGVPQGLLTGKKALVMVGTGGYYEGAAASADFVEPLIRTQLGFMGITDVQFVRMGGAAIPDGREGRQAQAREQAVAAARALG